MRFVLCSLLSTVEHHACKVICLVHESGYLNRKKRDITSGDEGEAGSRTMTVHIQIAEFHKFNGETKEWTSYLEHLECYFMADDVAN